MRLKIASIIGARPQFIKYFPVSRVLKKRNMRDILIHTGQHYDYLMSKVFFDELSLKKPDYYLGIGSLSRATQIREITRRIKRVLVKEKPDVILVYGDTNSTCGGAISAVQNKIPLAHIEAGLRSYNFAMPEEMNRMLTDAKSDLLLCPCRQAVLNLKEEGFQNILNGGHLIPENYFIKHPLLAKKIPLAVNVGDIMFDSLKYCLKFINKNNKLLNSLGLKRKEYYLFTMHRQANTDYRNNFKSIIRFINKIAEEKPVIFPMHPRAKKCYRDIKIGFSERVKIIEPLGYFEILTLLDNSRFLLTDSGGMQKEAYWLNIPCITLREETEWVETTRSGWNILFKNYKGIFRPSKTTNPVYGDGNAAGRIVDILAKTFGA